jgi:transcriptional regulator with XRE-family HTH domain
MKRTILNKFGLNVRRLRRARGLTQETLAERSESHPNYIGDIERGERNPSVTKVIQIARALNCEIGDLFEGVNTRETGKR